MALPIVTITQLLLKLASTLSASESVIKATKELIKSVKRKNEEYQNLSSIEQRVSQLEKGMDLTAKLSEEINEQLRIIQSLFENIKKSLRILSFAIYCIGLIALIAIILSAIK